MLTNCVRRFWFSDCLCGNCCWSSHMWLCCPNSCWTCQSSTYCFFPIHMQRIFFQAVTILPSLSAVGRLVSKFGITSWSWSCQSLRWLETLHIPNRILQATSQMNYLLNEQIPLISISRVKLQSTELYQEGTPMQWPFSLSLKDFNIHRLLWKKVYSSPVTADGFLKNVSLMPQENDI